MVLCRRVPDMGRLQKERQEVTKNNGIVSGQALERVQVHPQIRRFVIDQDTPAAKFIQEFWRRQTADFGRPPQRYLFALIEADGDVHQGIPFVQRDVGQPLAWNRDRHFDDEGSAKGEIWEAARFWGSGDIFVATANREKMANDAEESQRSNRFPPLSFRPPCAGHHAARKSSGADTKTDTKRLKKDMTGLNTYCLNQQ